MEQKLKPLHLACANDDLRPNMFLIEIKNGIASATNGSIVIKTELSQTSLLTPEEIEILNDKYIHKEVWKEIYKCEFLEFDDEKIICSKNGIRKIFEYAQPQGEFFSINSVFETAKKQGEKEQRIMSFRPHLIQIIQKVFQEDQVYFSFGEQNSACVVFPRHDSGMCGIIMPMMMDNTNRYFFY